MTSEFDALEARLRDRAAPSGPVTIRILPTPVGPMLCASHRDALVFLEFGAERRVEKQFGILTRHFGAAAVGNDQVIDQTERELNEYFEGRRRTFDVPLTIRGTSFQERVWNLLLEIPYGETRAYADLSDRLGVRNGQRAVGLANGQNRISIIVPCHRVIERSGGLRGYGGGLENKKFLLDLERRQSDPLAGTPLGRSLDSSNSG